MASGPSGTSGTPVGKNKKSSHFMVAYKKYLGKK